MARSGSRRRNLQQPELLVTRAPGALVTPELEQPRVDRLEEARRRHLPLRPAPAPPPGMAHEQPILRPGQPHEAQPPLLGDRRGGGRLVAGGAVPARPGPPPTPRPPT